MWASPSGPDGTTSMEQSSADGFRSEHVSVQGQALLEAPARENLSVYLATTLTAVGRSQAACLSSSYGHRLT